MQEEMDFKAIIGPFPEHPCDNGYISPFMTRDKPGSKHRRVIIDLSWPLGSSVNAGIDKASYMGTDFVLVLPTVDNITDQLKVLGRGAHLYKIDIIGPSGTLRWIHWIMTFLGFSGVTFRSRHGSQIFPRLCG